jgi:phage/plasmid-associated DNA primase
MLPKLQKIAVFFGQGGTGKGTCSSIMKAMLPSSRLTNLYLDQLVEPSFACKLMDARVNFTGEVDKRKKVPLKALFNMSGGGTVAARDLYKSSVEFKNSCAFVVSTNNFFHLDSVGSETERRFADTIVEFFKKNDSQDDYLEDRIIDRELGLALTWAMKGVQLFLTHGLVTGHSRELYSRWTSGVDPVALFVEECLRFTYPRDWFDQAAAWKKYKEFCLEAGYREGNKGDFFTELLKYPKLRSERSNGVRKIKGALLIGK